MKIEQRQRTVVQDYKVYIAKDGQEFDSEDKCKHHEMILNGTRKVCEHCGGNGGWQGKWIEPYDHWDGPMGGYHEWHTCPQCKGKGYLEKKVTWE